MLPKTNLFNMPNLKSLSLDTCQLRMNPDSISDNSALSSLSIKSIEILDNYTSETDGFFTYVDYDVIELSEHMDFFNHFKNLKELTVNGQKINDVNAFCNITTLETLDLTDNNITDFSPLASLSNLKSLTIKNNSFTEDPSNINLGNDVEIIQ